MRLKLLLIAILANSISNAQTFTYHSDKTFGGNNSERFTKILSTSSGSLLIGGISFTNINADKTISLCDSSAMPQESDMWILKTDTAFNIIWQADIGGSGLDGGCFDFLLTSSGKIIAVCSSSSDSSCQKTENNRSFPGSLFDYWVCMLDSNGNKIWDKTFGGTNIDQYPQICELSTKDFIIIGSSNSLVGADKTAPNFGNYDIWIIKIDSLGNKLWDKSFGGSGIEQLTTNERLGITATNDGGFLFGATTNSPLSGNISQNGFGNFDYWVVNVDSSGNILWDKRYGGNSGDRCRSIIQTSDNGFIVCGETASNQGGSITDIPHGGGDGWIIKLDSLGNKQWDKLYGGTGTDGCIEIKKSFSSGYFVGGRISSDTSSAFGINELPYGVSDYWFFEIDSVGNLLWNKRYGGYSSVFTNFIIAPDSTVMLCGVVDSSYTIVKTDTSKGSNDYWIVKLKPDNGNVSINEVNHAANHFSILPNPSDGIFSIFTNKTGTATISVYNTLGVQLHHKSLNLQANNQFDFSVMPSSIYYLRIQTKEINETIKFIKK